jgi:anion-transporting  ArsA/GET3 family ATPase
MKFENFLKQHKVFLFAGNGGTGKTTLSATWALDAAHRGLRVGLMTIDPSRRLGDVFAMNLATDDYKRHPVGQTFVDVHLIQSQKMIKDFIVEKFSESKYNELTQNKLFKEVVTRLAENQSLSTIYKLSQILRSTDYDVVIVDTPPVNHTADFFRSPERTLRLFKENILAKTVVEGSSFTARSSKKIFSSVLGFLTGEDFVHQMETFFNAFFSFQEEIVKAAEYLQKRLKEKEVCYFLVTSPEPQKVQELDDLLADLQKQGISQPRLIVNRAYPEWLTPYPVQGIEPWPQAKKEYDKVFKYYDNQRKRIEQAMQNKKRDIEIYYIPEKNSFVQEINIDELRLSLCEVFK